MSIINPYEGIDWTAVHRVLSASHQHLSEYQGQAQAVFNALYDSGIRHFAISKYRPSVVTYPAVNGDLPYLGNEKTDTEDLETLRRTKMIHVDVPEDALFSPNAEHTNSKLYLNVKGTLKWTPWSNLHINGIGSMLETATVPDPQSGYANVGTGGKYTELIDGIAAQLQYADGGGAIFNHPSWNKKQLEKVKYANYQYDVDRLLMDCLDYSPYVIGTDVLSGGGQGGYASNRETWDKVLMTGRRCWGFAQNDWLNNTYYSPLDPPRGRNELLVAEVTEHECLRAYRNGALFARFANTDLSVDSVIFEDGVLTITTTGADSVEIVIDGDSSVYQGGTVQVDVPQDAIYVRAAAYKDRDEDPDWQYKPTDLYKDIVLTQPIILHPMSYPYDPAYDHIVPGPDPDPEPEPDPDPEPEPVPEPDQKTDRGVWATRGWMWG